MSAPAFRLDLPFKAPTNAGEFGAIYFGELARADPAHAEAAKEYSPWLDWCGKEAPFLTQDPLIAMAWVKCALNAGARQELLKALVALDQAIEGPTTPTE